MNVKILSVKDMNGKKVKLDDFVYMLFNGIGFIKEIKIGEYMILYDNNARTICHRSTPVQKITHSDDKKTFSVEIAL